jgi:hypothetical protein
MTVKTGLRYLFEATRQWFVDNRSALALAPLTGTATVVWTCTARDTGTGAPIHTEFLTGGTVGTAGITYRQSLDNGANWQATRELGESRTITLTFGGGVLVYTLSAGTIAEGASLVWTPQPIAFAFGELEPPKQDNQGPALANRILFVPGVGALDADRKLGKIVAPRGPGPNPAGEGRHLGDLLELFQLYCWAHDRTAPEDAAAQHDATLLLFTESLWPALWACAGAIGPDGALNYLDDGVWKKVTSRAFGRELVTSWAVRNPMVEAEYAVAFPGFVPIDTLAMPQPQGS